jgi:hypothetical protein
MSTNPFDNIPNDVVSALTALTGGADASAEYGMSRVRRWFGFEEGKDTRYTKTCLVTPDLKFDDEFRYFDNAGTECKVKAFRVQFSYTLMLDGGQTHEQEGEPIVLPYCDINTLPEGDKAGGGPRARARMMQDRLATDCAALMGVDPAGWKAAFLGKGGWLGVLREIYNRHSALVSTGSGITAEVEFTINFREYTDRKTNEKKKSTNGTDVIRKLLSGAA